MAELREGGAATPDPQHNERYTYADYYAWDDGKRWELIDGIPYAMTSPSTAHQRTSRGLFRELDAFLRGKPCELFAAPYDVRLNAADADDTVVQPDLIVVCDRAKIDARGCKGVPDLVIEILSPSTARHDRIVKLRLYRQAGVREYWMLDPASKELQVCVLHNGQYITSSYGGADSVPVSVLPGCSISLPEVFAED